MNRSRICTSGIAAMLSLSMAAPALAVSSDELLDIQTSFRTDDLCNGKTGTLRGRCISDVLKRIKALREEFRDALKIENTEWRSDHSHLGVSAEYKKALQEYTRDVSAKRRLFNEQQRDIEKAFFAEQKKIRTSAKADTPRGFTRTVKAGDMKAATKLCSSHKDSSAQRLCMRRQLRLIDPAARRMGGTTRTENRE